MPLVPYVYNAVVESIYDGDTLHASIDLGLGVWQRGGSPTGAMIRFVGCNARELREAGGPEARDNLKVMLPVGTSITLRSVAWDKYGGRLDADVVEADGTDVIAQLVAEGWLAAWSGFGPKPVPPWPRS